MIIFQAFSVTAIFTVHIVNVDLVLPGKAVRRSLLHKRHLKSSGSGTNWIKEFGSLKASMNLICLSVEKHVTSKALILMNVWSSAVYVITPLYLYCSQRLSMTMARLQRTRDITLLSEDAKNICTIITANMARMAMF